MKQAPAIGLAVLVSLLLTAYGSAASAAQAPAKLKVGVVIDGPNVHDAGFNEYTVKGAQQAAAATGMAFSYVGAPSTSDADYERNIVSLIQSGTNLVITVGFRLAVATAQEARQYPNVKFVIVDIAYTPGSGCPTTVKDCYTTAGGLSNVTSLLFREDQVGYLAGVLAGCMTRTGTIATVAGLPIPPVVRYVTGFQHGARSVKPSIATLNKYIPDFNDPATGKVVAEDFILKGADVIFAAAGNTGTGALLAARESGRMAIGVDVDQYYSYPAARAALLTSASKNVDVAAAAAVRAFAAGKLRPGVRLSTLANGGVGLAPYHDWENKIPSLCKARVQAATKAVEANPAVTGIQ